MTRSVVYLIHATGEESRALSSNCSRSASVTCHGGHGGASSSGVIAVSTASGGVRTLTGAFRRVSVNSDQRRRLSRDSERRVWCPRP